MSNYQFGLLKECGLINEQIDKIIGKYSSGDAFCTVNRQTLIEELHSNLLIKNSPSIVGIVEYATRQYVYMSENIVSELDITAQELLNEGLGRALINFEDRHRKIFLEVFYPLIFEYYSKYAAQNEAKDLHIAYNTLLKGRGGKYRWYYHQLVVLACDEKGFPHYAMKFLSNIDEHKNDETISFSIHKKSAGQEPELIFSKDIYPFEDNEMYSSREREVMKLVSEGYSTKSIADRLNLSEHTISTHRKNVAKKAKQA